MVFKKQLVLTLLLLVPFGSGLNASGTNFMETAVAGEEKSSDMVAVKELAEKYIKATYEADVPGMRTIFHEKAHMNGYLGGKQLLGTPEDFFKGLQAQPSMKSVDAPYKGWVEDAHVTGNVASVIIKETGFFGKGGFTNYMHMIKLEGRWWIISKTFTSE